MGRVVATSRQAARFVSQRPEFRWTVLSAVPMSVFGASYWYARHNASPAVKEATLPAETSRKLKLVKVLQRYFNDQQMLMLQPDEKSLAPDFYEDVFTERGVGDLNVFKVKWGTLHRLMMRQRLDVLKVYLQFIREYEGLPTDFQEEIAQDIEKKIVKTEALVYLMCVIRANAFVDLSN